MPRPTGNFWRRWRAIRKRARGVLAMNQRNLQFIYRYNDRRDFAVADDKLITKEVMRPAGVPVPRTYRTYSSFYDLRNLESDLRELDDFVIKPSKGSGGGGIVVIAGRDGDHWVGPGGTRYSLQGLRKHISDIIFGVYSFDLADRVILEERVAQHSEMTALTPFGLADVRIILFQDEPVAAMTRLPTRASGGRANLHQGALGVGIDMATGKTTHAILNNRFTDTHPDTGAALGQRRIPCWNQVVSVARKAARAVPLKYLGVDICLTGEGPVVLEINVRPGLQIQNANLSGIRTHLESML